MFRFGEGWRSFFLTFIFQVKGLRHFSLKTSLQVSSSSIEYRVYLGELYENMFQYSITLVDLKTINRCSKKSRWRMN